VAVDPARAAVVDNGRLRFLRAGPDVEVVIGRLSLGAWGWGGALDREALPRLWQAGGGLGCLVRLTDNLDAVATLDVTTTLGSDPAAADFDRRYASLSVVAHVSGRTSPRPREQPTAVDPVVQEGRVRFRL